MSGSTDPDPQDPRAFWKARSAGWTATTVSALPTDDSLNQALIEAAGIEPGQTVLDLASGTGDPSISIARALGPGGAVTACDLTPEMLAVARRRADELELGNWRVVAGDMVALPFADATFDAVTCRFGLMFPTDRIACATEARRVLGPGGPAAWLVWGTLEENPTYQMTRAGLARYFGEDFAARHQRHVLGEPGLLGAVLTEAGFERIEERTVAFTRDVEPGGDYFSRAIQRAFPDRFAALDGDAIAALIATIEEECAALRHGGVFRIPSVARIGIGRKGGGPAPTLQNPL